MARKPDPKERFFSTSMIAGAWSAMKPSSFIIMEPIQMFAENSALFGHGRAWVAGLWLMIFLKWNHSDNLSSKTEKPGARFWEDEVPNFLSPADGCIFNGRCNTKSWARGMLFDRIYHATCSKVVLIICNHGTSGRFVGPAKHQLLNRLHGLYSALENSYIPKNLPFMNAVGRFMRVNNQSTTWGSSTQKETTYPH